MVAKAGSWLSCGTMGKTTAQLYRLWLQIIWQQGRSPDGGQGGVDPEAWQQAHLETWRPSEGSPIFGAST